MGSKKVKKKVKVKKSGKVVRLKKCRLNGKSDLSDLDVCQSLETFSEIRENYFNHLRNVVKENFECVDNENFPSEELEKISLEVEQQALLACMQTDVYRKAMIKIIREIRKSTQKMKLNVGIRNVIKSNNLETYEVLARLKSEERDNECGAIEEPQVYSHIPTISSIRTNYNEYDQNWTNDSSVNEFNDVDVTSINTFSCDNNLMGETNHNGFCIMASCEAQNLQTDFTYVDYISMYNCNSLSSSAASTKKPIVNGVEVTPEHNGPYFSQNLVPLTSNSEESQRHYDISSDNLLTKEPQVVDPISKSRNELQKSVEISLRSLEEIKVQRKEEIERAKLVKLLEDDLDDEVDDNQYDSLSDYCDESGPRKNEIDDQGDNLFADRLEEMRQIFGMEEEEEERDRKVIQECTNNISCMGKPARQRKPHKPNHMWYHERVIQMHKYSMLASEMTEEMRNLNRSLFLQFFGEDSDEENEIHFQREEKYLTSCKERISSWVVKYLMPFYHKKKIIGRSVFKTLGHHVSNSIIERIKYPDEWTVKYLVTKFFPSDTIFIDESDVFNFRIE